MQHLCDNQLVLSAPSEILDSLNQQLLGNNQPSQTESHVLQLPLWPIENAIIMARSATSLTVQFTTINQPPVVAYQLLCLQQPALVLQAQYLNEFGLYAGTISNHLDLPTKSLPLNVTYLTAMTDQPAITRMANEVFDLGWPGIQ